MNKMSVKKMVLAGVMTALVFVFSLMQIPMPFFGDARLHLGTVMCLLAAYTLGPVTGGLAAGLGSALYDLTNPMYTPEMPITFVMKFAMAFVCGIIAWRNDKKGEHVRQNIVAGVTAMLVYVVLYSAKNIIKNYFFLGLAMETTIINVAQKSSVSLVNGIIAVVASVPLNMALQSALKKGRIK